MHTIHALTDSALIKQIPVFVAFLGFFLVFFFLLLYLQPEFIVGALSRGDALEGGVLPGVHLHVSQPQEVR